ncbi:MAG: glycosyltransferase N-terminal domain-containing protein [bacterium]
MKKRHPFWFLFYNFIAIPVIYFGLQIARFFNSKIREGIVGRRGLFRDLADVKRKLSPNQRLIVIHCASAGEFEAARPIITAIHKRFPNCKVHVTCYSPSGYDPIQHASEVDSYSYLPFDSLISAHRFFRILDPDAFLIVKHDVWPNMVWAASRRKIPVLWINANLHERTKRLYVISRGFNKSFLSCLEAVLTIGEDHAIRLSRLVSPMMIEVIGDSRFDRTLQRWQDAEKTVKKLLPLDALRNRKCIVGGSTWGPDQRLLIPTYASLKREHPELFLVLVPHEPHEHFLDDTDFYIRGYGLKPVLYSQLNGDLSNADVLIVDKVGVLASLYRIAWIAYVGGAFGDGVHSVLEPAVFGVPLFFGEKYYMSHEAQLLVQRQGAFPVDSPAILERHLRTFLEDENAWRTAAQIAGDFVKAGSGASERIVDHLERVLSRKEP